MTHNLPDLPPKWQREPRADGTIRPGRNTKQEDTYETNFNDLRGNYSDALEVIKTLKGDLRHERESHGNTKRSLEISEGRQRELQQFVEKLKRELSELLCVAGIWAHLSLLMPESEVVRDPKHSYRFSNCYGTYEIVFSTFGTCTLKVTPAIGAVFNRPFEMVLLKRKLESRDIAQLRGCLGFSGDFLPNVAKKALQLSKREQLNKMIEQAPPEMQLVLRLLTEG